MLRASSFPFLPKDFIETREGLVFAVVCYGPQAQKVGCFLRYVSTEGGWQKVSTEEANTLLADEHPHYLYHSADFDAAFHAVSPEDIIQHYRPEVRLKTLLKMVTDDAIVNKCQQLMGILCRYGVDINDIGVTGSMLLGCQKATSDIDLAVYGRDAFHRLRLGVQQAIKDGELAVLSDALMRDNYQRRQGELAYDEFSWHEARKFNKAVINGTKFDLGMVDITQSIEPSMQHYQKQGQRVIEAKVVDDQFAFDFPARYRIEHELLEEIVVYTQTYVGQAKRGEMIQASGMIEMDMETQVRRLIVGSTREAVGEYIRVLNNGT